MKASDKTKGFLLGAVAAATYGMNPLFALPLYKAGLTTDSVLFYRYILAIPMLAAMILIRGRNFKLSRKEIPWVFVNGILMAFSSLFLFQSYGYMDAGIASTLLFVYPIMVALIMAFFFKEKITMLMIACIALALSGIYLLYNGDGGTSLSGIGVLLVMLSSLSYAIYIVIINKSPLKNTATVKLTFYCLLIGVLLFFFRLDFGADLQPIPEWYYWGNALALAAFPTVISFICTTRAINYIGATPTAILGALEPVTAVVFGITVFGEALTVRLVIGLMMIVIAVTLIVLGGHVEQYLTNFRKLFPSLRKRKNR